MFQIDVFKVAELLNVPGPQVFWQKEFEKKYDLAILVVLIRTNQGNLLINTGPSISYLPKMNQFWQSKDRNRYMKSIVSTEDKIAELGVSTDDINHVIITPLQSYANGNLDKFKNAEIYLSRPGWTQFHAPERKFHPHEVRDMCMPSKILENLVFESWNRINLVEKETEILPNITVEFAGCHHRSSLVVWIQTDHHRIAVTDAVMHVENVQQPWPIGINESLEECLDLLDRLRKQADIVIPLYDSSYDRFSIRE